MLKPTKKPLQILGIIPARGGSKRIPNKNIKLFNGKPLLYYTIKESKKSKYLTKLVVSTENNKISKISKNYSVDIIKRPINLSKDNTDSLKVFQHVISYLEKNEKFFPDLIVILQPTSPLRQVDDIDGSIEHFLKTRCDTVSTVSKVEHPPHWMFTLNKKQLNQITIKGQEKILERYQMPDIFQLNGAVQVTTRNNIMEKNSVIGKTHLPYIMPTERSIDIDTILEFKIAEQIFTKKLLK